MHAASLAKLEVDDVVVDDLARRECVGVGQRRALLPSEQHLRIGRRRWLALEDALAGRSRSGRGENAKAGRARPGSAEGALLFTGGRASAVMKTGEK